MPQGNARPVTIAPVEGVELVEMPPRRSSCTVCRHPHRALIEDLVLRGVPLRTIQKVPEIGVEFSMIGYHHRTCMGSAGAIIVARSDETSLAVSVNDLLTEWSSSLMRLKGDAASLRELKDFKGAAQAERALQSSIGRVLVSVAEAQERRQIAERLTEIEARAAAAPKAQRLNALANDLPSLQLPDPFA